MVGLSPAATALRIETEELISQLRWRRPELVAWSDELRYSEALHYASVARQLLNRGTPRQKRPAPTLLNPQLDQARFSRRPWPGLLAFAQCPQIGHSLAVLVPALCRDQGPAHAEPDHSKRSTTARDTLKASNAA